MGKKVKQLDLTPVQEELQLTPIEEPLDVTPVESVQEPLHPSKGFFNTLRDAYHSIKSSLNTPATSEQQSENEKEALNIAPEFLQNAVKRGIKSSEQAEYLNPYGIDKTKAAEIAKLQKEINTAPASQSYQEFTNAPSFKDAAVAFGKHPLKVLAELTAESMTALGNYGATRVAAGAAIGGGGGAVIAGPPGAVAGLGGGAIVGLADTSLALEFSASILDSFRKAGVDVSNPEELQKAFENDALIAEARAHAYKKSIPIALFDLVSGGVAGKIVTRPAKSLIGKIGKGAAEFGIQAGLGMAGETTGELASGEQLQPGNILAEGLGELGTTPVEVTAGVLSRKANAPINEKKVIVDKVINDVANTRDNTINAQIDSEVLTDATTHATTGQAQGAETKNTNINAELSSNEGGGIGGNEITNTENIHGTEPQEKGEGDIEGFVARIKAGEQLTSPEDLQFYENNKTEIESKLKQNAETIRSDQGQVRSEGNASEGSQNQSSENLQLETSQQEASSDAQKQIDYQDALDKVTALQKKFTELPIDQNADELLFDLREARRALAKIAGEPKAKKTALQSQIEKSIHPKQEPTKVNPAAALKEQIKAHYKNIETGVKKGRGIVNDLLTKITDTAKEHNLTGAQVKQLVNKVKATNPFRIGSISKLNEFVEKVANDADYADQLNEAETFRGKIKKALKGSKSIEIKNLAKAFSRIDPSTIGSKLGLYSSLAEDLVNHYKNPGQNEYEPVNARKVRDFTDTILQEQLGERIKEAREEFKFGPEVSDTDIENYLFDEDNLNEDPFSKNRTEANDRIIHDKIRKVAEYSQLALEEADFTDKSQQPKIDMIARMDLSKLNNSQLVDYIRTVDNMVENEDFSNTDKLEARAKAIEHATKLRQLIKDNELVDLAGFKKGIYSLPQIFKAAYKSSELASEAYRLSGLGDYYNSTSKVESQENQQFEAFRKKFDELKRNYPDFDKAQTQVNAGVFASLVRYAKGSDPSAALAKSKYNIEQSIKRLKESPRHQEMAKDVEAAYEKFKDAQTIPEVFSIMRNKDPRDAGAYQIWKFWNESFQSQILPRLKKVAGEFHNENFVEEENYTPKKFFTVDTNISSPEETQATRSTIGQRQQAVTAKAASNNLNPNQAINFNFYENMFRGFRESLYDIETTRPQQLVYEFMKLPESKTLLGGEGNKEAIIANWKKSEQIAKSYGASYKEGTKIIDEASNLIRTLSYTRALGGITQFPKQYISVALSTIANLGGDAGLFFGTRIPKEAEQLFNMYTIGQRSKRLGGVSMGESVKYQVQSAYASATLKFLGKTNKLSEQGAHVFMKSLTAGDVSVAKRSWVAYYLQSLKRNGVDLKTVDLAEESKLQGQEERKKAAAFAEQKVKETQLTSNPEELGTAFKTLPGWGTVAKNILLPFSSFSINSKVRITEGINRLRLEPGNTAAYRELGAVLGEQVVFTTVKYYIIQAGINTFIKPLVESMFDLKGAKKKDEEEQRFKQWYSDIIKDVIPITVGTGATNATVGGINWIGWLVERPKASFQEWQKQKKEWIYNYHKQGTDLGLYSVGLNTIQNFIRDAELAYGIGQGHKLSVSTDYGDAKVRLTDSQKQFVITNNIFDVLSLTGFMDADLYNLIQKINREQLKKGQKRAQ